MNVPHNLKQWRRRRGLTQAAAARVLRIPHGTLRNWEQGHRAPRGLALRALRAALQ